MEATSLVQIIKVGDVQDKKWEGREYQVQEAECILLKPTGEFDQVGVLRLNESFRKNPPGVGIYQAVFSLVASPKDRRIGAVVTSLTRVEESQVRRAAPKVA